MGVDGVKSSQGCVYCGIAVSPASLYVSIRSSSSCIVFDCVCTRIIKKAIPPMATTTMSAIAVFLRPNPLKN